MFALSADANIHSEMIQIIVVSPRTTHTAIDWMILERSLHDPKRLEFIFRLGQ